ncbi:Asp-tRNA(Asn)/Glu-tRNA(Gln) amidotransferase subunit GatB [Mucilaginibacter myungsuensis]|uniref:Aspartyl/glutamyl-tRNA(Asn/Gln) amidotransferase subunit B n=1 Tax=Mucilaginibacter myungsuensis TaxID=649104 RepID=A0A929L118_9SPHI|nr:Asp-tRNA(Asn)/Glu-tRNA(Gln) amidotransferase subunit GatB [Mucilaginibacter myungsuensis]MBE9664285.1 Asp-tRNA(Asn)/Glu-tRNA(Gln) amidotransferase subunit GatB [Mucilaginibacter myungsuensis]MDN3599989.1 Asp-tRNA(Asn)/Glu-tRNA(Gln) amidotransferase subunit GatB [Mucilaginibacter myungsuensis]
MEISGIDKYELVVGLEVHAQLSTQSKIFSADSAAFGGGPNQHISMVSLGHPGTLPFLNKKAVSYAVKMGLACNCTINLNNHFARKNYFYADLPKGYQISQDQAPICLGGRVPVKLSDGTKKDIAIHHIHLEEDAGKSMHDQHEANSLIDLNRAGVPLIEIVSEPDLRSAEEAGQYLTEIRKLVRYLDVCDGNMEEGSLRCDANISVRLKGAPEYGNRCEVKNLNSIRNVQRAIEHEFKRQVSVIEAGGRIDQNTLNFDADTGETSVLRSKEMANDYRYFPEPDLPPLVLTQEYIDGIRAEMPALPAELYQKYTAQFGLSEYDASVLTNDYHVAHYYEQVIKHTNNYKAAANWLMGSLKSAVDHSDTFVLKPEALAGMIALVDTGKINHTTASHKLLPELLKGGDKTAEQVATELNLFISDSGDELDEFIAQALAKFPDKVAEYKKGKKGVLGLFMGEIMKRSKGKIDPQKTNQLLIKALEK